TARRRRSGGRRLWPGGGREFGGVRIDEQGVRWVLHVPRREWVEFLGFRNHAVLVVHPTTKATREVDPALIDLAVTSFAEFDERVTTRADVRRERLATCVAAVESARQLTSLPVASAHGRGAAPMPTPWAPSWTAAEQALIRSGFVIV